MDVLKLWGRLFQNYFYLFSKTYCLFFVESDIKVRIEVIRIFFFLEYYLLIVL